MNPPILWQILLQVLLIASNAVFACAEIAVISMNDNKLARLAEQGNKRAVRLARLTSQPARFLATIQVAITLSGFLGSAFAADNFSDPIVEWLLSLGVKIPASTLNTVAVIVITIVLSYFTLIFGELVPKRIAMKKAEKLALALSGLITVISKLFAPIVWFLTVSTNALLRLCGIDPNSEEGDQVTEEEIRMMVDVGSEKGVIDPDEKEMIQNVFEFNDLTAGEIVTHRTEITLLWMEESEEEWAKTIRESRHSRYPVCDESVDNVVGILNAKDYFRLDDKSKQSVLKNAVKPAFFVPESIKADLLFRKMKQNKTHIAIVLDEHGGMCGIVTIDDLVEQLVGEMKDGDEQEDIADEIEKIDSGTWKICGSALLDDVSKELSVELPAGDYDTFGGLIFSILGSIPEDGSTPELDIVGLHIKVSRIKEHKIVKTIVCKEPHPSGQDQTEQ